MEQKNIALYLRISDEDDIIGESNSITGQRLFLENYVSENKEFANYKTSAFIDDGYSGTNFNRPGISRLLELARKGEINCIIVKDFSRLGRNYLEVGNLIEQVFPFLGIRFISVSDCFDSSLNNGAAGAVDVAFKNLIHDLYSKDISQKIISVRRTKAEMGKFVTAFAPYGYVKSSSDKNKLVIDEECAVIVRRIFQMVIDGVPKAAVARQLNAENIPSPMTVRKMRKDNFKSWCANESCHWIAGTISHILNDRRYTGDLVYGKVKPSAVGSRKDVRTHQDEWIITPDAHPAIVSREIFETVESMKRKHNYERNNANPLTGKIKCGVCNRALSKKTNYDNFTCRTHLNTNIYNCFSGKLNAKTIENAIITQLNLFLHLYDKADYTQNKIPTKEHALLDTLSSLNRKSILYKKERLTNYEAYKENKISKDIFLKKKQELDNNIEIADNEIERLEKEMSRMESPASNTLNELNAYGAFEILTREITDKFIKSIIVDVDGRVQIHWNFSSPFEQTTE